MKRSIIQSALMASALFLSASLCLAAENVPGASKEATSKAKSGEKSAKAKAPKAAPKVKLVDINSASKAELKKLPRIGDAEADKIVAGRPYLTKAHLVTHNVIPRDVYEELKTLIVAKQK